MIVVGVSGRYGSGKSEALAFLQRRGFVCLSLSDEIRAELARRNEPETRERMIEVGNELRRREGAGALAIRLIGRMSRERNWAVDSIRNPAEVAVLRDHEGSFRLVWIDADEELRFERLRRRQRPGDPTTLEAMRVLEERELRGESSVDQQLDAVRELADFHISNDKGIEGLQAGIQKVLKAALHFERPGWDDYFMRIAQVVSSRSNCVKRRVASVITKDQRIVSTGYNGTPRGVTNCNEGGCPRCSSFGEPGRGLDSCLCSHGEENAIIQSAFHGVSVRGGTLYTTLAPCLTCTKMIINSGISEVVYNAQYTVDETSLRLLDEAGVQVRRLRVEGV